LLLIRLDRRLLEAHCCQGACVGSTFTGARIVECPMRELGAASVRSWLGTTFGVM